MATIKGPPNHIQEVHIKRYIHIMDSINSLKLKEREASDESKAASDGSKVASDESGHTAVCKPTRLMRVDGKHAESAK